MISLCYAISSIFCFSVRTAVAVALRWKKATTFLTRPSKRLTRETFKPAWDARFNVCAKHLICGDNPASLTATSMMRALSVTTAVLWGAFSSSHSCIAAFKTSAMLVPVCDSESGRVWSMTLFISHSVVITCAVTNIALTSPRSPPISCYCHILCFFQTVEHLCFSFAVQGWNYLLTEVRAWWHMVPGLQYPNQFTKSNIVDHRKWSHVFCNKNWCTWLFLELSHLTETVTAKLHCIDVWLSFTLFVAGVYRSLLWCRFKWHIVFDVVYSSLVLQFLQTVCVLSVIFLPSPCRVTGKPKCCQTSDL